MHVGLSVEVRLVSGCAIEKDKADGMESTFQKR